MDLIKSAKNVVGQLTELGLMLLALGIVVALLYSGNIPFFGNIVGNITKMVADLGQGGLTGLIALGLIFWLFSKRSIS